MAGHVARSVGGALPGVGSGLSALVAQRLLTADGDTVSTPAGATFAFVEVQARGGYVNASSSSASAGGAASDAIVAVTPGSTLSASLPMSNSSAAETASVSLQSSVVISAASPATSAAATQTGPSGKYPGGSATGSGSPGRGGGRLAGAPENGSVSIILPGNGSGRCGTGGSAAPGGRPIACVTFFRTYEAALAFANSLYGGNWQP